MAGDKVTAQVQYYYPAATAGATPSIVPAIVNGIIAAISGGNAAGSLVKGATSGISSQLNAGTAFINAVQPAGSGGNTPKAFLTILFFDERFNFISAADGGVAQSQVASSVTGAGATLAQMNIRAPRNGYVFVYVSNQSDQMVYFDNLKVGITAGNIIEEDHYYSFGMKIASISSVKLGDVPEGVLKNNYLYQGEYSEFDVDVAWNDFALRNYDPQIGRWVQQDPYQQFPSPYVGMGNDPVNLVDPSGGFLIIPCPGTSGFAIFMTNLGDNIANLIVRTSTVINVTSIGLNVLKMTSTVVQSIDMSNKINGAMSSIGVGQQAGSNDANPIYGRNGKLLGTDDRGLQGAAIIMDQRNFVQGMKHEDAVKYDLAPNGGSQYLRAIPNWANYFDFYQHYSNLPNRPDYDGFVTIREGINWAKSHPGAIQNPTPDNMLYIDASKLDFGNISISDFKNGIGKSSPINLNTKGNFAEAQANYNLASTVYALGRVNITLLDIYGRVKIVNDFNWSNGRATDYDWNRGGSIWRRGLINYERWSEGLNDSHGFRIFYYGVGKLRR